MSAKTPNRPVANCIDCGKPVVVRMVRGEWKWSLRCKPCSMKAAHKVAKEIRGQWAVDRPVEAT